MTDTQDAPKPWQVYYLQVRNKTQPRKGSSSWFTTEWYGMGTYATLTEARSQRDALLEGWEEARIFKQMVTYEPVVEDE